MSGSGARTRRSDIAWSVGAAGPLLRLVADNDTRRARWIDFALCAEVDPDLHFPEKGESTKDAKAVCAACPVRHPCLEDALERNERGGVRGGLSVRQRDRIRRQRRERAA